MSDAGDAPDQVDAGSRESSLVGLLTALRTPLGGWVFLGLLVRLILMPLTAHTDALIVPWPSRFVALGSPNPYDALFDLAGWKMITPVALAPYQPLYYAATGAWLWLTDAVGWLSMAGWDGHWTLPHLERGLFLLKAAYLPFDLGVAAMLALLVPAARRTVAVGLWMMCPVVIWAAYVMGQNDAMPTFFVVLALLAGTRALQCDDRTGRGRWRAAAAVSLGVGAAFKLYPLLLLPVFALQLTRGVRPRIALLLLGTLPALIVAAPFRDSHAFVRGALLNIEATSMLGEPLLIGTQSISVFAIGYVVLLAVLATRRESPTTDTLWIAGLVTLTLLFTTGRWAYNWLYWLMPFAVLSVARIEGLFWLYLIQVGYFLAYRMHWRQEPWLLHFSEQFFAPFGFRDMLEAGGAYGRLLTVTASAFVAASWGMVVVAYRRLVAGRETPTAEPVAGPARWPWLIPVPLVLVVLLTAGLMYATTKMIPGVSVGSDALEPAARLSTDVVLEQEFYSERRNLRAIELPFGTYGQAPTHDVELAVLRAEAAGGTGEAATGDEPDPGLTARRLGVAVVNGRELVDNKPYTFRLDSIGSSIGPLAFSLSSPGAPPEADLTVFRTTDDEYPDGALYRNDDLREGDIAFTAYYEADWREAWSDLRASMKADRWFFAVWAILCWGLVVLAAAAFLHWRSRAAKPAVALAFTTGAALILVATHGSAPTDVGDELRYLGHHLPSQHSAPGDPLSVKLYWQSRKPVDANLTAFVHLRDDGGQTVAQADLPLEATIDPGLHSRIPVTSWLPGEVGAATHHLWLPPDVPPGDYRLFAGVYDPATMQRLPPAAVSADEEAVIRLPSIRVESRP